MPQYSNELYDLAYNRKIKEAAERLHASPDDAKYTNGEFDSTCFTLFIFVLHHSIIVIYEHTL